MDLTDRKKADEKLRNSEERYRSILESAPILCLIYKDGVIDYINQFGCALLGADRPAELLGHSVFDYVHQESKETTRQRAVKVMSGQPVPPGRYTSMQT
jgi:PAS domain S-box-containing protein